MGSLFSSPKPPPPPPPPPTPPEPEPMPVPDDESDLMKKRRELAIRSKKRGRASTILTERGDLLGG